MKKIPLLDLQAQYATIRDDIRQAVDNVLEGGAYIMGPEVKKLEQEIAEFCGVKHAIGVANGTDALLLVLDAAGVGPGDEVITTPFTFFASAEVISQLGATPVFADIDPKTYNIDVEQVRAKITNKTKAIIPVHIFGQPAEMDELMKLAEQHNLFVLEDAAQAIDAEFKNKKIGNWGHAGTFSFFPTKNLGGYGDGGMIVTNDDQIAEKVRILRVHGSNPKYYHSMIGYNSRLDELQAAALRIKLRHLRDWNDARRQKAAIYDELLKDLPVVTPYHAEDRRHVYHLYIIQADDRAGLMNHLKENGIATGIYYPVPLHRQNVYESLGYGVGSIPISEKMADRTFAIPLYPELTREDQEYIAQTIRNYYK
ncbi:DegT/DnrJ/EryC1/StrS family aminotransferase [Risungbinella massiliensis]|uniref:DegT/DnrJ/EryC1/StrS family aminotransferase n=1 Tax=Risungbinella massiliensis TaxID=1329796 RepID=UPI0005CC3AAB|nr:DegT/DnrJ/EryC1/StrS family aminotransferase [Risungbinella massiliensis]